jgi:hypothetical protein
MRREQLQASLTVVVEGDIALQDGRQRFAIAMLAENSARVRRVGEIAEIATEVRRELRA